MSSRALRKSQKERELAQQEQELKAEESSEEDLVPLKGAKPSAFALLEADEGDENVENTEEEDEEEKVRVSNGLEEKTHIEENLSSSATGSVKKKKKKKKSKAIRNTNNTKPAVDEDEIDAALRALKVQGEPSSTENVLPNSIDSSLEEACKLLSIEIQNLNVGNEMKRLFGRAAFDVDDEQPQARSQRGVTTGDRAGLADIVAGKNAIGGAGLPSVMRRRNILMQGKEEWPKSPGSGLGMEIVERRPGDIIEFRFTHNKTYQNAQREFDACVRSMDPAIMVNCLRFNPYHVSTLLQVSEIAKHEKDYTTSGDLLERSLFAFGRALHPSFGTALAKGKARLDFRRPENREFWLAVWKYIGNIGMRATWRTAYEWARLLLSLSPEKDPYEMKMMIDQLALRCRQFQNLLDLCNSDFFACRWDTLPNMWFSRSLAMKALSKDAKAQESAKKALATAIDRFPWVASRMFQDLGDKIPTSVWGKSAMTAVDELQSEYYVTMALDIWKAPEANAFLKDVVSEVEPGWIRPLQERDITLSEARHVLLTERPPLIGLLPHTFTSQADSASDPLPPTDDIRSYETGIADRSEQSGARAAPEEMIRDDPQAFILELNEMQRTFEDLIPGFTEPANGLQEETNENNPLGVTNVSLGRALQQSGLSVDQLTAQIARFVVMREALMAQPQQRVISDEGDEAFMTENGLARVIVASRSEPDESDD